MYLKILIMVFLKIAKTMNKYLSIGKGLNILLYIYINYYVAT